MPRHTDEVVRTTVRLPRSLHVRLKEAVYRAGTSSESFIKESIEKRLESVTSHARTIPSVWGPSLAQRFLECLPTPAVIKDNETRIVWCNLAYEELFHTSRGALIGRNITDMGLLQKDSAKRLEQDMKAAQNVRVSGGKEFWEPLSILAMGGATILFRAHRFVFKAKPSPTVFLGDVSFDWGQIRPGTERQPEPELTRKLTTTVATEGMSQLFQPFMSACPAAIAIKELDGAMMWCNAEYEKLAKKKLAEIVGMKAQQIFGIPDLHPLVYSEAVVANANVWMYAVEELPESKPRTSLRFPLSAEDGTPRFIGVVSAEFQQEDISSHAFRQRTQRKPKDGRISQKL